MLFFMENENIKMTKIIKVRCNGPGKHINKVDLEKVLRTDIVMRTAHPKGLSGPSIPERIVLACQECTNGKVIISRAIIEENL